MARARETQGMGDIGVEARASAPDMRPANETIATVRENYPIADVAEALWDVAWQNKWQEKDRARLIEENARLREALEEREGAETHSADREGQEI
jgi:hypothetical protein